MTLGRRRARGRRRGCRGDDRRFFLVRHAAGEGEDVGACEDAEQQEFFHNGGCFSVLRFTQHFRKSSTPRVYREGTNVVLLLRHNRCAAARGVLKRKKKAPACFQTAASKSPPLDEAACLWEAVEVLDHRLTHCPRLPAAYGLARIDVNTAVSNGGNNDQSQNNHYTWDYPNTLWQPSIFLRCARGWSVRGRLRLFDAARRSIC